MTRHERIETEHLGYAIHYSENEDVWRCQSLDLEAKTLSAIKSKMGKTLADARRVEPVAVLVVTGRQGASYRTGKMVLPDADGKKAWCMVDDGTEWWRGAQRPVTKRELHDYKSLLPDTPENRAALDALQQEWKAYYQHARTLDDKLGVLPRIQPMDLTP